MDEALPAEDHEEAAPATISEPLDRYAGSYRTTVAARHTWEFLLAMMDTIDVSVTAGGAVDLGGGEYVPVGEGIFQWHEGGPYYIGFTGDANGRAKYLLIGGGSYERVPWYGAQTGASVLLMAVLGVAVAAVILWAVVGFVAQLQTWNRAALIGALARIGFVAVFGATFFFMDPQQLFYGMPQGLAIAIGLALAGLFFDAVGLLSFLSARRGSTAWAAATIYFASSAVFTWWLSYWNLLGWQTG